MLYTKYNMDNILTEFSNEGMHYNEVFRLLLEKNIVQ